MAYTYTKLADVTLVESATTPNLLIEEGGDIKKISASNLVTPQIKADWEETDPNSSAYILNKPDLSQVGGANVVTYTIANGALKLDGIAVTKKSVVDTWKNGSIIRIDGTTSTTGGSVGLVTDINYTLLSGVVSAATVHYYSNGVLTTLTL